MDVLQDLLVGVIIAGKPVVELVPVLQEWNVSRLLLMRVWVTFVFHQVVDSLVQMAYVLLGMSVSLECVSKRVILMVAEFLVKKDLFV
jgi:hypothetical protein